MPERTGATAAEYSAKRFAGPTRLVTRAVGVTTSSTQILKNNPRRVFWQVLNRGAQDCALDFQPHLDFTNSILVAQAGGFASMAVDEDAEAVVYDVYGICNVGSTTVYIIEVERV